ncbi:serine--tRNA ligase [Candidatus Giovannonibacteria bacterium]|nr:serine--tRNA ligase [Candidatus Giovannonibacteria bacterium]
MLDIRFVRENKEIVREALRKRRSDFDLARLLKLDAERRALLQEVEVMRSKQNEASENISRTEGENRETAIARARSLKEDLQKKEAELLKLDGEFDKLMLLLPNIPDPAVPEGESEEDNVELRRWGSPPDFSFAPKDYLTLLRDLDLADLERGAKVSGFRGYFLKNEGVLLSLALWKFALDFMTERGFTPFISPSLVREDIYIGSGKLPLFREDLYATDDNLYLAATAEVPMMGYWADEILSEDELPKKCVALSPCFRREAGAYGKDTKGLFRRHEFMKVEQVVLCAANHQESVRWHEELTRHSEEMLRALGIPYRVVINSTADLPFAVVKMYDIECWTPSEERYRETHSSSLIHDFQTRRLKIRYKSADGKIRYAHSLNNTAIATPRIFHALLENHQQADGSVLIPEILQKHVGKNKIFPRD